MLPLFCVWTYISQVENNKMLRKTEEARSRGRTGFVLDRIGFHHFQLPLLCHFSLPYHGGMRVLEI